MGYTHYFYQQRDVTAKEWVALCEQVQALIKSVSNEIPVRFEYESVEPPLINDDLIRFNGVEDDGHETFVLSRFKQPKKDYVSQEDYDKDGSFAFCKTARKPYDTVVTATLLAAMRVAKGAWRVGSDGDADEWFEGFELACDVLNKDFTIQLGQATDSD